VNIDWTGKTVLVTGGTCGIGRRISLAFARAGARVVTCYRDDRAAAESLARELERTDGAPHVVRADVSRLADIDLLMEECRTRLGHLDAIVNNAGAITHIPFAELQSDDWRRVLDTNLTASMFVVQRALPLLAARASIVHVGSRAVTVGMPLRDHYTAAKAGLTGLTRSMAKELGPRGIRVNLVAPGPAETEAKLAPEVRERYTRLVARGRLGCPQEIAKVVLFLASDLAGFVTGETVYVAGGV
jgi:3-oxoacyl-[acyl-carrier protein] reductase